MILTYAVRSSVIRENSALAYSLDGTATAAYVSGTGLGLEALALIKALSTARKEAEDLTVLVSPRLLAALSGSIDPDPGFEEENPLLDNLKGYLERYPQTLTAGAPSPEALAALEACPPVLEHFLSPEDARWVEENSATVVYTDGASMDGIYGTWGWYVDDEHYGFGHVPHLASSLTAERYAVKEALASLEGPLLVLADRDDILCAYDVDMDVLELPDPALKVRAAKSTRARFTFVKGHALHRGNIAADRLATSAMRHFLSCTQCEDIRSLVEAQGETSAALTLEYREQVRAIRSYCDVRIPEIVHERHPEWASLTRSERRRLHAEIYAEAKAEFLRRPLVAA